MIWAVVISVIGGFILLTAITFAIPSQTDVQEQFALHHDVHLADVDGHDAGPRSCSSSSSWRSSSASRPASRRARGCCSRSRATEPSPATRRGGASRAIACPSGPCVAVASARVPAHGADLLEQPRRLLRRHVRRDDRALHRVHPARDPAAQEGRRASSTAPGASGTTTSGSTRSRSSGSSFISIVFMLPTCPAGIPWNDAASTWNAAQLRAAHDRRRVHPLRRLVGAVGEELVRRPRADGHRRGARAARGQAGGASSCCRPTRSTRR